MDVFDLVDAYATAENLNIETKTISDLSIETGLDRQTLIDDFIYGEDGLAIYDPVVKRYTILINEKAEPFGRVRWTVAHELGHIVLSIEPLNHKAPCLFSKQLYIPPNHLLPVN